MTEKGYKTDAEKSGSENESFLKEKDLTDQHYTAKPGLSIMQKTRACLTELKWKSIIITVFLWIAVLICSAEYSVVAPFFPQEVISIGSHEPSNFIISL